MKRHSIFLTISILSAIFFCSCEFLDGLFGLEEDATIHEVYSYETSVSLKELPKGSTVYLAKINPSNRDISDSNTRRVESFTGDARSIVPATSSEITKFNTTESFTDANTWEYKIHNYPRFENAQIVKKTPSARSAARTAGFPAYQIGTPKELNIETSSGSYTGRTAYLRAAGTYCYVWVVDGYFTSNASGNKIDAKIAQNFANKFDEMYPLITNIYGNESDYLYEISYDEKGNQIISLEDIEENSDTGNMINIVICDIPGDTILGEFSSKDYYFSFDELTGNDAAINYSNWGKYFYIDAYSAVNKYNESISTLAHEFQHMISFYQKNTRFYEQENNTANPIDTNLDEMLSMLCEDMMQSYLRISDKESPKGRLQWFNAAYYKSGIRQFNNTDQDSRSASYSNAYAFGAWLCREYGGASLVQRIMRNNYTDNKAITMATNIDMDTLILQFMQAITGSERYTLNKAASKLVSYKNYNYPMNAIDLFSDTKINNKYLYAINGSSIFRSNESSFYSEYNGFGPMLFNKNTALELKQMYGFSIHGIAKITEDDGKITVNFGGNGSKDLKMYLIVQ
ncbi:MAG: hypothetical protein KBT11_02330 [Treponema sp.]|nr:hypothetical protein [Candidatus Treponema equifaecale]